MEVDFDGLRKNVARSFNCLVRSLNTDIQPTAEIYTSVGDIREYVEDLRTAIGTLLLLQGDAKDVKDMSDEVKLIEFAPGKEY